MEQTIILKVTDKKSVVTGNFISEDSDNISVISIRNRKRSFRKFVRSLDNENVIISHSQTDYKLFDNRTKIFDEIRYKTVFPVINKITRQVAEKYKMQFPLEEICIIANMDIAFCLISRMVNVSKLFTVVTDKPLGAKADELYFEYGCIIRKMSNLNNLSNNNGIIIYADWELPVPDSILPIINITGAPICLNKIVNIGQIFVSDERINEVAVHWEGKSGLLLYSLLDLLPLEDVKIDINKSADRIFLLDREKI